MTNPVPYKSRIPHWGWLLLAAVLLIVVFAGIRIGTPVYQQHLTPAGIAKLKAALPYCEIAQP